MLVFISSSSSFLLSNVLQQLHTNLFVKFRSAMLKTSNLVLRNKKSLTSVLKQTPSNSVRKYNMSLAVLGLQQHRNRGVNCSCDSFIK